MDAQTELNRRLKTCCRVGDVAGVRSAITSGAMLDYVDPKQKQDVTGLWLAAEAGKVDICTELISAGANVNFMRPKDDASVLYVACQNGHMNIVKLLLAEKTLSDVDQRKQNGSTPLFISAQQNHADVAELLLARGADPNVKNDQDVTAFILSCYTGNASLAVLLLRHGADPYQRRSGQTGMQLAKAMKFHDVVARVFHYTNIVQPMSLLSAFVIKFFQNWLETGVRRAQHHPSDEEEVHNAPLDSATDSVATGADEDDGSLMWTLRDLPDGNIDYEPIQLSGNVGNRLRPVIVPGTLRDEAPEEDDNLSDDYGNVELQRTLYGYDYADADSQGSTVYAVPSVSSCAQRRYQAHPSTHILPKHRYLQSLENAYEAEFGKGPEAENTDDAIDGKRRRRKEDREPKAAQEAREKLRYKTEVDAAFKALFPLKSERRAAREAYYNQDIQLTRTLHCAATGKGRDYRHTSISHAMATGRNNGSMVNETCNMKTGAKCDVFAAPSPMRKKDSTPAWKKELRQQKSREQAALRKAQATAVTAKIEKQVLEEHIYAPSLLAQINRGDRRFECQSRDTRCAPSYLEFHSKEFKQ